MCSTTLLLTLLCGCCQAVGLEIFGVAPADQEKYAPIIEDSKEHFRCLNETSGRLLPYSAVNDDFCDCADASDEPGTSACAGQSVTLFFCKNVESVPKYIYSSQVGDGICDCCDGSDEPKSSACPNTCAAEGAEHRRKSADRAAMLSKGLSRQQQLIESAKTARLKRNVELEQFRAMIPKLEAIRDAHKAAFDAATLAWEEEEQRMEDARAADAGEPATSDESATSDEGSLWDEDEKEKEKAPEKDKSSEPPTSSGGPPTRSAEEGWSDEPLPRKSKRKTVIDDPEPEPVEIFGNDPKSSSGGGLESSEKSQPASEQETQEEKPQVSEYAKWMDGAAEAGAASATAEKAAEKPQVSEYAKWMEGSEKVVQKTSAVMEDPDDDGAPEGDKRGSTESFSPSVEEQSEFWKSEKTQGPDLDRLSAGFGKAWLVHGSRALMYVRTRIDEALDFFTQRIFGASKSPLERAREVAKAKHAEAVDKVNEQLKRVDEIQAQVLKKEDDEHLAYSALKDQCLSLKAAEYKYEVCFFKDAHQDSVSLGRWKDWIGPHEAIFDDGQWCPGGPARQIKVKFVCGASEVLQSIDEPSRCQYLATASHPGACRPQEPGADDRPRHPMDEL